MPTRHFARTVLVLPVLLGNANIHELIQMSELHSNTEKNAVMLI